MKVIAFGAVTAGGKTSVVTNLEQRLKRTKTLYFDDYNFDGAVEDFYNWCVQGADWNAWNLEPLKNDIEDCLNDDNYDYLLLDYPFAYCHDTIKNYIDYAIFIDVPLDIALVRRMLRDMPKATGDEIREAMTSYMNYERIAYLQMQNDVLLSSDFVIDGTKSVDEITNEIIELIKKPTP